VAYRAEIEVGVKGAQRLQELRDSISKLSNSIDAVNAKEFFGTKIAASINTYNSALADAQANLNKTRLRLDEAGGAAGNYARSIKEYVAALELSNGAQALTNRLISEEIELRRKQKLAASGIRESTQYGGPIGPGPASPVGMLAGQTSPVEERIRRTLAANKEQLDLQESLLRLEERSAQEVNKKVQAQEALIAGTREVYELIAQTNREAATGIRPSTQYAGPIGPGPASPVDALVGQTSPVGERIARIRAYEAAAIDAANNVSKLAQEQEQAITQKELQNDDKVFKEKLNKLVKLGNVELQINKRNNEQALKDFNTRLANRTAGRFRTDGPLESPGFKSTQKSIGKMGESLALGAGFPLLFGGGAGSVAGSILGSFVGSGFGGQILGGALGQALDQTLARIRDIGNAIQGLNFDALLDSGIRLRANLREQLDTLIRIGQADKARQLISQEVATQTGTVAGTVEDVGNSVNILGDSWNKITVTVGALLGILSAPFAVALAGILEVVNAIVYALNTVASLLGKGLKVIVEFVVNLVAGEGAADRVATGIKNINKELDDANAKALAFSRKLSTDVSQAAIKLGLAQRLTPGVTSEDKITNIELKAEAELNQLVDDRFRAQQEIREQNKNAAKEIVDGLIRQSDAYYRILSATVELNKQRDIAAELERKTADEARKAAEAARKAAQERTRQIEAQRAAYSRELDLISQTLRISKEAADYDVQRARIVEGESAALKEQLDQVAARLLIDEKLLTLQLNKALNAKGITATERELTEHIYRQQLQMLRDRASLNSLELTQKQALIQLEKELAAQAAVRNAVKPFEAVRRNRELEQQYTKTYLRLVTEGLLPAEAERIANFEKLVSTQLDVIDQQIAITEAAIVEAEARGVSADKVTELREELERINKARGAVVKEAAQGPGKGQTDVERVEGAIAKLKGELNELTDPINFAIRGAFAIGDAFRQAFQGLVTGAMTAQEALASFFQNIADYFLDMAAQIIAKMIQIAILNAVVGLLPGSGGGGVGSKGGFSGDTLAQFNASAAQYRANGGPVSAGSPYVVGEKGPELFVPGKSGTIVPNSSLGGANVVVNVDASGSSAQGNQTDASALGRAIGAAVQAELVKQKRPGGLLA